MHPSSTESTGLHQILNSLGYNNWKPGQLSAITKLINGKDVFCSLPPGFGKSLIYQVAGIHDALEENRITFVITVSLSATVSDGFCWLPTDASGPFFKSH